MYFHCYLDKYIVVIYGYKKAIASQCKLDTKLTYGRACNETSTADLRELHVFADASQRAYAAAVYVKCKGGEDTYVRLLTAKTKVAPIEKEISIPRMELCAAVLATKLIHEVSQTMRIPKTNLYAWSDSTVVLAWLGGEPTRWATFVSNRVSEILTVLDRDQWNHVKTDQNPADCASRGMSIAELAILVNIYCTNANSLVASPPKREVSLYRCRNKGAHSVII
ncbi:unnamed protein product, partial [Brenthis ino]